ncbi:HypC/HybG/HupF family hydrogenase formation chaperone [Rhodoferax sp.]|uniref:HypC/HybG/HupF family hydrogenase formation chaperone n=1 Tax=Rhodoferax sp. TaxID=50421 RepID=UPI00284C81FE|nr:HypC/HybG/HupF family hydrogenase formation chaperone [Rhodoferax sp.]MDR3369201.1 HypC/HybG/HupF family hydrogenase formation chaperone [Rhodoferax sp.]
MCIGIPMQVTSVEPGFANVAGRDETRRVGTRLIGDCVPGQWLLVFLDDAREMISPERAAEVNATLDLLAMAIGQDTTPTFPDEPGFLLPSGMDLETVQRMTRS